MQTNNERHNDESKLHLLPNITEDQYRIIITALHTLEEQYPKDNRITDLTDLISTQTFEEDFSL